MKGNKDAKKSKKDKKSKSVSVDPKSADADLKGTSSKLRKDTLKDLHKLEKSKPFHFA